MNLIARVPAAIAVVAALALAAVAALAALQPTAVSAQSPAFEEQYELRLDLARPAPEEPSSGGADGLPSPAPTDAVTPTEAITPTEAAAPTAAGAGASAGEAALTGTASGELPLAGYPLTPFVLLLLGVLLGGLAIRAGLAVRDRLRGRHPGSPT